MRIGQELPEIVGLEEEGKLLSAMIWEILPILLINWRMIRVCISLRNQRKSHLFYLDTKLVVSVFPTKYLTMTELPSDYCLFKATRNHSNIISTQPKTTKVQKKTTKMMNQVPHNHMHIVQQILTKTTPKPKTTLQELTNWKKV